MKIARMQAVRDRATHLTAPARGRWNAYWNSLSPSTRAVPPLLLAAVGRYTRYGGQQASALAYYAIFSLFPLALLVAIFVSRLLGPALAQQQLSLALSALLPPSTTDALDLIVSNVQQALDQGSGFTIIAIIGLLWAGTGLFSGITNALDRIFETPPRNIWRQRLTALGMAVVLLLLLALSFVSSAVIRLISALVVGGPSSLWLSAGALALPVGLNLLIFALLFKYVPARRVHWDAVWPAALIGAVGWEIAKAGFSWYLTNVANYQFVYGTLATGIILLFWAFLIASIFMICGEICAALNNWYIHFFVEGRTDPMPSLERPEVGPALPDAVE